MIVHPVFYCGCVPCKWACDNGNHRANCPHDKSSEIASLRAQIVEADRYAKNQYAEYDATIASLTVRLEEAEAREVEVGDALQRRQGEVAALTAELTEIKKLIESDKYEGSALCQMYLAQSEAFKALTASLAELRKRMGEAVKALGEMLDKRDGEPDDCLNPKCGKGEVCAPCLRSGIEYRKIEEVLSLLASPPSPAPVESKER